MSKVSPVFDLVATDVLIALEKHSGASAELASKAAMAAIGLAIDFLLEACARQGASEEQAWDAFAAAILTKAKMKDGALLARIRERRSHGKRV